MSGPEASRREWRIGELADATGLSARALRHYEQVGLLSPSTRTEGGHRVYGDRDVDRLYRICALKSLGMSLAEIREVLDDGPIGDVLRRHLTHVEKEARRLRQLRDRLRRLMAYLDDPLPSERLVALLSAMSHLERELRPHQLDRLAARRGALGADGARELERDWRELATLLRSELDAGSAPGSASVLAIARRARDRLEDFTGGDPAVYSALDLLRAHLPSDGLAGWDTELLAYLYEALARHAEAESSPA